MWRKFWSKVETSSVRVATTEGDIDFTCGFSPKICLRYAACLGTIQSTFFISMGTVILLRTLPWTEHGVEAQAQAEGSFYIYDRYMIYYTGNDPVLLSLSLSILIINGLQILGDLFLLMESFRTLKLNRRISLKWLFYIDLVLWSLNLMSLVVILSGSGLLLLILFLVGTSIRSFILGMLYQLITQFRKLSDSSIVSLPVESKSGW